jgi:hypothetical protein
MRGRSRGFEAKQRTSCPDCECSERPLSFRPTKAYGSEKDQRRLGPNLGTERHLVHAAATGDRTRRLLSGAWPMSELVKSLTA